MQVSLKRYGSIHNENIQAALSDTAIVVETAEPRNLFCSILVEEGLKQFSTPKETQTSRKQAWPLASDNPAPMRMSPSQRAAHPCIGSSRTDFILSGCAIFEAIARTVPIDKITIADRGVREGIIVSLMREVLVG